MKTYNERTLDILAKAERKKKERRRITAAVIAASCCLVLVLGLVLFLPYTDRIPSVSKYQNSEYYPLIKELQKLNHTSDGPRNNYEKWFSPIIKSAIAESTSSNGSTDGAFQNSTKDSPGSTDSGHERPIHLIYQDVTQKFYPGFNESSRIQHSDKYIFYFHEMTLNIYSIDGYASNLINTYTVENNEFYYFSNYRNDFSLIISEDGNTLTMLLPCHKEEPVFQQALCIVNLDVSDPTNIRKTAEIYIAGEFLTHRLIDGTLYMITNYETHSELDFATTETYLPQYGTRTDLQNIPGENIIIPANPNISKYMILSALDPNTLTMQDTLALFSYSGQISIFDSSIYLSRTYFDVRETPLSYKVETMTEIAQVNFSNGELEYKGSFQLDGLIRNGFCMDERDGILRVAASTSATSYKKIGGISDMVTMQKNLGSVRVYSVDLTDYRILSSIAGEGDYVVRDCRYDGDKAYIRTTFGNDGPVLLFDVSDPDNITCAEASSGTGSHLFLTVFFDDYLLGADNADGTYDMAGLNFPGTAKYLPEKAGTEVTVYQKNNNMAEKVCSIILPDSPLSTDHAMYFIDPENQLFGVGEINSYLLFRFNGKEFEKILSTSIAGSNAIKRAFYADGYLYMFGDEFIVEKIA